MNKFTASALSLIIANSMLVSCPAHAAKNLQDPETSTISKDFAEANALVIKGDYPGAMDKLTSILIKEPGNGIAREQIYQIAQLMGANATLMSQLLPRPLTTEDRADAVEIAYRSLRKSSPRMIERRIQEAAGYENRKYFLLASQAYLSILQLPGLELEKKYAVEKRLRAATQKVDARIDTLSEDSRAPYREAFTLMSVGDWNGSADEWLKYLSLNSDTEVEKLLSLPEAKLVLKHKEKLSLASAALVRGEVERARAFYEEILKSDPGNGEAEKGLEEVEARIELAKRDERVNQLVADAEELLGKGKKPQAVKVLSKALRENPGDQRVLALVNDLMESAGASSLAFVPRAKPQNSLAEKSQEAPAKIQTVRDSGRAETHYQKGLVYYSLRNYREAFSEWRMAVQFDPSSRKISQALQRVQSDLQFEKGK